MDIYNMTIAQLIEKAKERQTVLVKDLEEMQKLVREANKVRETLEYFIGDEKSPLLLKQLNEAEDKYWELQDKFYELDCENDALNQMVSAFNYLKDCKDLSKVASHLGIG